MTTITSRRQLSSQTDQYVLVDREDTLYVRVDEEYIAKKYFTTKDLSQLLGKPFFKVHRLCRKFGIQSKANKKKKIRVTLDQLRKMSEE